MVHLWRKRIFRRALLPLTAVGDSGESPADGKEIDEHRRPQRLVLVSGRGVLDPILDLLVVVAPSLDGRGRRVPLSLLLVRVAMQGQQFGLEALQKAGRREFRLPVRARLAEHTPRVYDDQERPLGPFQPAAATVYFVSASAAATSATRVFLHGHAGRRVSCFSRVVVLRRRNVF